MKTKKRAESETTAPDGTATARAMYDADLTFRLLIDEWVKKKRCPLVLVDRCLELNLNTQAECARWAAAQPDRWCGENSSGAINCGTFPARHNRYYYFVTDDVNPTSAYSLPRARTGGQISYATNKFKSALSANLWLLDSWTTEPARKKRTTKKRPPKKRNERRRRL